MMSEERQYVEQKQVIVMRNFKSVRKGKFIAQGCHASLGGILKDSFVMHTDNGPDLLCIPLDFDLEKWLEGRFKKVVLVCETEEELLALHQKALDANLRSVLITDSGLTEFNGVPTNTCISIGPHKPEDIDPITGHLKPF